MSYSDRRLCVLEGSSVDFLCTYSHPSTHTVTEVFWYYSDPNGKLKDLRLAERFAGRVEFLGDEEGNCSLRMRDVRKSDSGEYRFRFITNTAGVRFSGTPGVVLKVTGTCQCRIDLHRDCPQVQSTLVGGACTDCF